MEWLIPRIVSWTANVQYRFGVNPVIFGILYFGTIPPYIYAWIRLARSIKRKNVVSIHKWATVVATIFILPYAYVFFFGRNLPVVVYIAASVLMILLGWKGISRYRKLRRVSN